jgi:hypothetical protein
MRTPFGYAYRAACVACAAVEKKRSGTLCYPELCSRRAKKSKTETYRREPLHKGASSMVDRSQEAPQPFLGHRSFLGFLCRFSVAVEGFLPIKYTTAERLWAPGLLMNSLLQSPSDEVTGPLKGAALPGRSHPLSRNEATKRELSHADNRYAYP